MLVASISYACIKPSWDVPQIILTALTGIGCAGPLTLLVACVQFTAPHAYLSTATGLAFSARAIGGAFGTAVIYAVINSRIMPLMSVLLQSQLDYHSHLLPLC
jgi:hypothetical protein